MADDPLPRAIDPDQLRRQADLLHAENLRVIAALSRLAVLAGGVAAHDGAAHRTADAPAGRSA